MNSQQVADLSNGLIYSSMFVLVLAMVFFAVSFAGRRTSREGDSRAIDITDRVHASVGGGSAEEPRLPAAPAAGSGTESELAPGRRAGNIGLVLSWLAFGVLLAGVVARGVWAGRAPWGNMYEFSLASAVAALGIFLAISVRRDVRWLGIVVIPAVLLILGSAVTILYTEAAQLVPALDSYWLVIHVSAAIVCGGAFTVAGLLSGLFLLRDSGDRRGGWAATDRLPTAEMLDGLAYKIIAFTMPLWTFAIVSGAIWAEAAWGRYWGWDPKETWALITWLVFAGYLHARATAGWRGRKAAWLALIGLLTFVFNYFGVNLLFSGLHSYAGV